MNTNRTLGKRALLLMLLILSCATTGLASGRLKSATGNVARWSFDTNKTGKPPAGSEVFSGTWEVRAEADAPTPPNILCQTGHADYPALSLGNTVYRDVVVSTSFMPISGGADRAAGIIFRIRDRDNYYILRANALEDNVNIYKFENGRRSVVKEGTAKVQTGIWQELIIEVKGNVMRGFLNGKLAVEAADATFQEGKVGLWTKADSVTCFDNVKVTPK